MRLPTAICALAVTLSIAPASAQSITPFQVQTASYRLHMFNHGNHALNVAGLWMPGNICLVMRTPDGSFVQYKSEQTPELALVERRQEDGAGVAVIQGMLSENLRFTQTVRTEDLRMTVTYEVEALADLIDTTIHVGSGAGPKDRLPGLEYVIQSADGERRGIIGEGDPVTVRNVQRITWPGLGHRDVSWVFGKGTTGKVIIRETGASYEGTLLAKGDLAQGERLTGTCSVEIEFEEGFTGIRPWSAANVGPLSLDVDGATGMVHHLRTDRGNIVQQLNLNEKTAARAAYQSSAGNKGPGWSGVAELEPGDGEAYRAQSSGPVLSEWQETVTARETKTGASVDVKFRRVSSDEPTDLRLLVYLAQRLEDRGQVFRVKPTGGGVIAEVAGTPMTVGMQPRDAEGGLGPYTDICELATGDRIIIPMLDRGEVFTITCDRAAKLAAFRFEIYFRGLWLDFVDDDANDVAINLQVRRMRSLQGPDWFAPLSPKGGRFALNWGGMPALDAVAPWTGEAPVTSPAPLAPDAPDWAARIRPIAKGLRGAWTCPDATLPAGLIIDLPVELVGREMAVLAPGGATIPTSVPRRIGAELPAEQLASGATLIISRTAREQVRLMIGFACEMTLRPKLGDGAQLVLQATTGTTQMALDVEMRNAEGPPMRFDTVDPRATETGLHAEMDGDDVIVTSPWWQVRQSAADGGCVSDVMFFCGSGRNVLTGPARSYLRTASSDATTVGSRATLKIVDQTPDRIVIKARGALTGDGVRVPYVATCEYRSGYLRQSWVYDFGEGVEDVRTFGVQRLDVRPELDEYLGRRLSRRTTRGRAVFPGRAVFEERSYSRYLCLFDRGVEGIEWLSASSASQWRSQLGEKGHARYAIVASDDTPGAGSLIAEAWADADAPIVISGTKTFEWITGLANIRPQLDREYFVTSLQAPDEEMVRQAAWAGANVLHLSAGNRPGSFTSSDLAGTKRIVEFAHNCGMKIYPFDAHALLHRTVTDVSKDQRVEWGTEKLNRQGKRELWVYSSYGDYMCEEAEGWREFMQQGFAGMMAEYGYDGLYYDFVHPILCYNDRHCPDSPHISSDGMLEMCDWSARAVGPDGIFAGHTGWVPTIACKNYCTIDVVYEEIGDDQVPSLERMPEQARFVNARPKRLVPSFLWHSALAPGSDHSRRPRLDDARAFTARCALIGVFPPPRTNDMIEAMQRPDDAKTHPFVGLLSAVRAVDLTTMEFADWQEQTAVTCDNAHLRMATYWNTDRALVVVANSEIGEDQSGRVTVDVTRLGWPGDCHVAVAHLPGGDVATLVGGGLALDVAGYDYASLLLTPLRAPGSTIFCTRAFTEQRTDQRVRVTTIGPTGQPGRLMFLCSSGPPVSITINGEPAQPAIEGTSVTVQFVYDTTTPTVIEFKW